MSVELKNMESFERASQTLRRSIPPWLNSLASSCAVVASQLAPIDLTTPRGQAKKPEEHMYKRIKQVDKASDYSLYATTESQADYSMYVEFGTTRSAAQPFMTPAFESSKRQLERVKVF